MEFRQFNDGGALRWGGITMRGQDDRGHYGPDGNDRYTDQ